MRDQSLVDVHNPETQDERLCGENWCLMRSRRVSVTCRLIEPRIDLDISVTIVLVVALTGYWHAPGYPVSGQLDTPRGGE